MRTSLSRLVALLRFVMCGVVFLAAIRSQADALPTYASFAGISFGISKADARAYLKAHGFDYQDTFRPDNSDEFYGYVDDDRVMVVAQYTDDGTLDDIWVAFPSFKEQVLSKLRQTCAALKAKYGKPDSGDCKEPTYWNQPNGVSVLSVDFYYDSGVQVDYEGPNYPSQKNSHSSSKVL